MAVGLTSIYDGEGQNNWFQFYLGISGVMCLSASQYSLTPLLKWQSDKNYDPRTGILHIVRDH